MAKYFTISQAAEKIGVNKATLRRWDKSGRFKSKRHPINNYRIYPEKHVEDFIRDFQLELYETSPEKESVNSPFNENENGTLYNTDVVNFLKSLESASVDLIFADPPYNIKKAEWDSFHSQKEYVDWCLQWITEAHRALKLTGTLYICGFSEILADIKWAASHLFKGCKWIVWYYRNKANLGKDWGRSHESLLHFRKSRRFTFNIDEVRIPYNSHTLKYPVRPQAETSQYGNDKRREYIWQPNPKGAKPKDVFEIPTLSNGAWEKTPHPTQKPVELVKKCILASSNTGDLVVDPFGGSGTTFAVAEAFGRRWLGNELDEKYCRLIVQRLNDKNHIKRIASGRDESEALVRRKKLRG